MIEQNLSLDSFTEEQREFVFSKTKSSIIFSAVAGSGKTFCAVHRMKELLRRGVEPEKIIFFSFTNTAIDELRHRVGNNKIKITTIHSFCCNLLDRMGKRKSICDFNDFIEWFKNKHKPQPNLPEKEKIKFEKLISNMQDDYTFYESSISSYKLQSAEGAYLKEPEHYLEYTEFLKETRKMDFSDILIDVRDSLKENKWLKMFKDKYDYLFIDEYQDTSAIQMEILLKLNAKYYYLSGDSSQAIYGYSGSSSKQIESMLEKRRKVIRMTLTTNFRSSIDIVENSNKFSSLTAIPFHKTKGEIQNKFINIQQLEELVKNEDEVVILGRTNHIVKYIEFILLKLKVPMNYNNYLKPKDLIDIKDGKISNLIKKRINMVLDDTFENVEELIKFIEDNKENKNHVSTIHRSKGREYHTCIIVNSLSDELIKENEIQLPDKKKETYSFFPGMKNYDEERNVHYVAVSRAKEKIYYMLIQV